MTELIENQFEGLRQDEVEALKQNQQTFEEGTIQSEAVEKAQAAHDRQTEQESEGYDA